MLVMPTPGSLINSSGEPSPSRQGRHYTATPKSAVPSLLIFFKCQVLDMHAIACSCSSSTAHASVVHDRAVIPLFNRGCIAPAKEEWLSPHALQFLCACALAAT